MSTRTAKSSRYLSDNVHAFLYLCHWAPGRCADVITIFRLDESMRKVSLFPDCFWQAHLDSSLCCKTFCSMPMGRFSAACYFSDQLAGRSSLPYGNFSRVDFWELIDSTCFITTLPLCIKIVKCEKRVCLKTHSSLDKVHLSYNSSLNGPFSVFLAMICICLHVYCLKILCNLWRRKIRSVIGHNWVACEWNLSLKSTVVF